MLRINAPHRTVPHRNPPHRTVLHRTVPQYNNEAVSDNKASDCKCMHQAEKHPERSTMLNMDAPTSDQLEVPVQPRKTRDVAKGMCMHVSACAPVLLKRLCDCVAVRLYGPVRL